MRQRSENLIQNIDILEKGLGEASKAKKEIAEKIKALNGQLADARAGERGHRLGVEHFGVLHLAPGVDVHADRARHAQRDV